MKMNRKGKTTRPQPFKSPANKSKETALMISIPNTSAPKPTTVYGQFEARMVQVQTRPALDRVLMRNKACDATPELEDVSLRARSGGSEQYNSLLIQQYGFNPILPDSGSFLDPLPFKPIDKVVTSPMPVLPVLKADYSSQCVNPTTTTGTNGTTIDLFNDFGNEEDVNKNGISPKEIEISNVPRLKVISEKFTRFKKAHIELRRLDERIICVEYDVYNRSDMIKQPVQVMRAYFCVKTSCKQCTDNGIFKTVPSSIRNSPLMEKEMERNGLETEVEMIDEKLPENKSYLTDLRTVLKKRQAMLAKKKKSSLDLMSMYIMAKNEITPRDHDWSNTNLLSEAELQEVKNLIMKKCESRMYNLSRKKMKVKETVDSNQCTDNRDSTFTDLFRAFDSSNK